MHEDFQAMEAYVYSVEVYLEVIRGCRPFVEFKKSIISFHSLVSHQESRIIIQSDT